MSTQLVRHEPTHVQVNNPTVSFVDNIEGYWRLANMLVKSGMVPQKNPEAAMAILLKAHELGIPAMHAFANVHFFDGKLVESAALMVGMAAERCAVSYEVIEWNDQKCSLLFTRPGWSKPLPSEWTIEDAKRAGLLGKDNWRKYPKAMLLARAQAQGVRAIAPDRFAGVYASEEMDVPEYVATGSAERLNAELRSEAATNGNGAEHVDEATGEVTEPQAQLSDL